MATTQNSCDAAFPNSNEVSYSPTDDDNENPPRKCTVSCEADTKCEGNEVYTPELEPQITKCLLYSMHRRLIIGQSNKAHNDALISSLGGINAILSKVLNSHCNVSFTQNELDSLYHVLKNTSDPNHQPPKENGQQTSKQADDIEFTFSDDDILLFHIFSQDTAKKITTIFQSAKMLALLFISSIINGILWIVAGKTHLSYGYRAFQNILWFVYCLFWILYANKRALLMLSKQFIVWFKIIYLVIFQVAICVSHYMSGHRIYRIIIDAFFMGAMLFTVMIFDAIDVAPSYKIIFSSLAFAMFAYAALYYWQISYYRNANDDFGDHYDARTMQIPDVLGAGPSTINLVDIIVNSGQILTVFILRQLYSSIMKPKRAAIMDISSIIYIRPLLVFNNRKSEATITKKLRLFTLVSLVVVFLWCFSFYYIKMRSDHIVGIILWAVSLLFVVLVFALFVTKQIRLMYFGLVLYLFDFSLWIVGVMFFGWHALFITFPFLTLGIISAYTVKAREAKLDERTYYLRRNVNFFNHNITMSSTMMSS